MQAHTSLLGKGLEAGSCSLADSGVLPSCLLSLEPLSECWGSHVPCPNWIFVTNMTDEKSGERVMPTVQIGKGQWAPGMKEIKVV